MTEASARSPEALQERSVVSAHARLRAAQKPGNGVPAYLRWVNRGLGRWAAAIGFRLGMTPNAMSLVSVLCSVGGMVVLVIGRLSGPSAALGAVLLLVGYALDSADGQLARLTAASSARGEWLDHVVDAFRLPAVHLAIAAALMLSSEVSHPLPALVAVGFALLSSVWFFSQILAEKLQVDQGQRPGADASAWVSVVKLYADVGFLYLVLLLAFWPLVFVTAYCVLAVLTAGIALLSMVRKYRAL